MDPQHPRLSRPFGQRLGDGAARSAAAGAVPAAAGGVSGTGGAGSGTAPRHAFVASSLGRNREGALWILHVCKFQVKTTW